MIACNILDEVSKIQLTYAMQCISDISDNDFKNIDVH